MTETRTRLLLSAEQLFAERGIEGVSLREIGAAAGQRNNSAVQYHFGDRDTLVRALYEWRLESLNVRREALVAALSREDTHTELRAWVDAFARPLFEIADGSSWYARFVARFVALGHPVEFDPPLEQRLTSGLRKVMRALAASLVDLPAPLRAERLRRVQLYVTSAIADVEQRSAAEKRTAATTESSLRDLVTTATALLVARNAG